MSIYDTCIMVLRRLSVRQHFQITSSLNKLDLSRVLYVASMGLENEVCCEVLVIRPRWPPRPYMVKNNFNLLLQNHLDDDLETWHVALGIRTNHSLFK